MRHSKGPYTLKGCRCGLRGAWGIEFWGSFSQVGPRKVTAEKKPPM